MNAIAPAPSLRGRQLWLLSKCRVGDAIQKLLLRTLDDHIRDGEAWGMSVADLAAECEVCLSTVYRKLDLLRSRGLITMEPVLRSKSDYRFTICWPNLSDLVPEAGKAVGGRKTLFAESESDSQTDNHFRTERNAPYITAPKPPPPPPPAREEPPAPAPDPEPEPPPAAGWREVEVELIRYGVLDPATPLEAARLHGCTPEQVRNLVAFAARHPGRWGGGGLRRRILCAVPGQDPEDLAHWPPSAPEWERRQRHTAHAERTRQESRRAVAQVQSVRSSRDDLEARWGGRLDGLGPEALDRLARATLLSSPAAWRSYQKTRGEPPKGLTRTLLLQALQQSLPAAAGC
jgi:hypothetical protein